MDTPPMVKSASTSSITTIFASVFFTAKYRSISSEILRHLKRNLSYTLRFTNCVGWFQSLEVVYLRYLAFFTKDLPEGITILRLPKQRSKPVSLYFFTTASIHPGSYLSSAFIIPTISPVVRSIPLFMAS